MKISACVIAKNESANIGRCLESLSNAADEIIVVDTGSTDDTVNIAKEHGAKVFNHQWDNNFSNAKNYAFDKAKGDWVIFLDADEYLDINTQKKLPETLRKVYPNKKFDAVQCQMIHTDGFNGRVISENPTMRIFRNNQFIRYVGSIHEKPLKNGKLIECAVINDIGPVIYHTGYALCGLNDKFKRNLIFLEEQERTNSIDCLTYYYLSMTHCALGNQELAVKYALLALEEPKLKESAAAFKPYVTITTGMLALKDKYSLKVIEKYVIRALELFPDHPEIWYMHAVFKKAQKEYLVSIDSYLQALKCQQNFNHKMQNDFLFHLEEVYCDLASLSNLTGNTPNAVEYYYQALKVSKYNEKTFTCLYELIKDQKAEDIVFFMNTIYNKNDKDDLVFLNFCMNQLDNQVAAKYYFDLYNSKFNNEELKNNGN